MIPRDIKQRREALNKLKERSFSNKRTERVAEYSPGYFLSQAEMKSLR